ncbi:MAG: DNA repair protein RecO [Pyrinomonadaceae bacterium]
MGLRETNAIVLRKYNLSDADRIVVFLTEKFGLVRGVAQGAKRLKSRFASSLELFTEVSLSFIQKEERELVQIRETEILGSVFGFLSHPEAYSVFSDMADLLLRFAPAGEPNPRLYRMSLHSIQTMVAMPERLIQIRVYFGVWLLQLSGFLPDWKTCKSCGRELEDSESGKIGIDFSVYCEVCGARARRLGLGVRRMLLKALSGSAKGFSNFASENIETCAELGSIITDMTSAVLDLAPDRNYGQPKRVL